MQLASPDERTLQLQKLAAQFAIGTRIESMYHVDDPGVWHPGVVTSVRITRPRAAGVAPTVKVEVVYDHDERAGLRWEHDVLDARVELRVSEAESSTSATASKRQPVRRSARLAQVYRLEAIPEE